MKDQIMSSTRLRELAFVLAAGTLVLLTGCAQVKLAEPSASIDNIQLAKSSGLAPVAVGAFAPAAGLSKGMDESVNIRSNTFFSPYDSSFAKYLQQTLSVELKGAGLLDSTSRTVVGGKLTQSAVEAGASQGTASLGARFNVSRDGTTVYEKELIENDSWPSSFVGAVAIPDAINHYTALYRRLVARLFKDEAFKAAVKP